jgi:2-polyprenyl-6-methoxyphenol hydroxylase-like FAD-dependent oxidoreductase
MTNAAVTRTALIIGGGIAGPIAAMALRRAGIDATVYETYPRGSEGVGGGLNLAPNGLSALDVLGLGDVVRPAGRPITAIVMQDWAGRRLGELGSPPGMPPIRFFWRSDLYRAINQEAARRGVRTEFGKRLVSVTEAPGSITAHFADGTAATGDVLIGADGIRSTVRTLIDADAPGPRYAGLISFGARLEHPGVASTRATMPMSFGKRAFFGYQVFDDDTAVWFVNLPHKEPVPAAEAQRTPAAEWLPVLEEAFAEDRTPARRLIARTRPEDLVVIGSMEHMPPRVPVWSRGRMVLAGDSAHAPSSSSGQGASLAIESAVQLARCLRDLPYEEAFAAYEALRRPRVEKIIEDIAQTNGAKTAGPVSRVLNAWTRRIFARPTAPEKAAWIFDHTIDWDAPVGPR